jgi:hypothetical protein
MTLQLKLCSTIEQVSGQNDSRTTNHRMSRIITKLFARVVKAEGNEMTPFSNRDFELGRVLKTVEETLIKCNQLSPQKDSVANSSLNGELDSYSADCMSPCRDLINTFVHQLLQAKSNQGKILELRHSLENAKLGQTSLLGKLFTLCCVKTGLSPIFGPANRSSRNSETKTYDSDYLSELIFSVGGAEDDQDRVDAMNDLREYLDAHKDIDIESHLSSVSVPFRKYILEQLRSAFRPLLTPSERSLMSGVESTASAVHSSSRSVMSEWSKGNMAMSEKLRYLKNKINGKSHHI